MFSCWLFSTYNRTGRPSSVSTTYVGSTASVTVVREVADSLRLIRQDHSELLFLFLFLFLFLRRRSLGVFRCLGFFRRCGRLSRSASDPAKREHQPKSHYPHRYKTSHCMLPSLESPRSHERKCLLWQTRRSSYACTLCEPLLVVAGYSGCTSNELTCCASAGDECLRVIVETRACFEYSTQCMDFL